VLVEDSHVRTKHVAVLLTLTVKNKRNVNDWHNIVVSGGTNDTYLNKAQRDANLHANLT
jgi:hypothetical protein